MYVYGEPLRSTMGHGKLWGGWLHEIAREGERVEDEESVIEVRFQGPRLMLLGFRRAW